MERLTRRRIAIAAGVLALMTQAAGGLFLLWGAQTRDAGEPRLEFPIDRFGDATAAVPTTLKVMTWNIAYGRGGPWLPGDHHARREVVGILERVATHVEAVDPDVLALQEVDFASDRTGNVDELAWLQRRLNYPYAAWVTTWEVRYVPYPPWPIEAHAGGIHMGMAVLSKHPIVSNVRYRLPEPEETSAVYDAFYVKRAVQAVGIEVGTQRFTVFNVHLESMFFDNRLHQIDVMKAVIESDCQGLCVLMGDLNSAPVGGAGDEGAMARIEAALPAWRDAFEGQGDGPGTWTFPAQDPARRLDHVLFGPGLLRLHADVYHASGAVSDHLPLVAVFGASEGRQ